MRKKTAKAIRKKAYENVKADPQGNIGDEYKRLKKVYKSVKGKI